MSATRPDFGPPYNNFYGSEYEKFPTVKEVAASTRKMLVAATKDETSPLFGAKVSVRYKTFSGGCSIDTNITSPAHVVHEWSSWDDRSPDTVCTVCGVQLIKARSDATTRENGWSKYWLTDQGAAMYSLAKSALDAHNHDRSDIQTDYFDVRFYGEVSISNAKEGSK